MSFGTTAPPPPVAPAAANFDPRPVRGVAAATAAAES